ncbi:hypothetical protein [Jatrophihabitans endophyticus]|uniref:hypothetical protein n=1 Tax=Jatrophihabitans endophyticus TaxID=1206085 RepID=UPI0019E35EFC|nr:hypothetical protein [Jatrophihabitans endophyticus]MBE7187749.1 hypothetical protein [Jatrophihabitans endophyticus]
MGTSVVGADVVAGAEVVGEAVYVGLVVGADVVGLLLTGVGVLGAAVAGRDDADGAAGLLVALQAPSDRAVRAARATVAAVVTPTLTCRSAGRSSTAGC